MTVHCKHREAWNTWAGDLQTGVLCRKVAKRAPCPYCNKPICIHHGRAIRTNDIAKREAHCNREYSMDTDTTETSEESAARAYHVFDDLTQMNNKLTPRQRGVCRTCNHSMFNKAWYGTKGRCGAYVFPNTDARPQLCQCNCKAK